MIDPADYATSPLNPALKLLVFILFAAVAVVYWDARKKFGGTVKSFIDSLLLFAIFMAAASLLRYFGQGTGFGFTSDYSLKWFQSLMYCAGVICLLFAAKRLFTLFREADHA
ncbi:hypothetical protein [uncultured Methanoregula sp.]|uniref:hypothetical protein n=1 Tax=uncultured Methanoregula sp. TaxID=1005933 RepID=UPI002AAB8FEF|nr:hypothetical protein [uncultured Methanoregula sp.]